MKEREELKPSVQDLEKILDEGGVYKIQLNPDGSISSVPKNKPTKGCKHEWQEQNFIHYYCIKCGKCSGDICKSDHPTPTTPDMTAHEYNRLVDWMKDKDRKPANTAFTAGWWRDCGRAFEEYLKENTKTPNPGFVAEVLKDFDEQYPDMDSLHRNILKSFIRKKLSCRQRGELREDDDSEYKHKNVPFKL